MWSSGGFFSRNAPPVSAGSRVASGEFVFAAGDAGAKVIALSSPITPDFVILDGFFANPGALGGIEPIIVRSSDLPFVGAAALNAAGTEVVDYDITSFTAGAVNITITGNNLTGGNTATLKVGAFQD